MYVLPCACVCVLVYLHECVYSQKEDGGREEDKISDSTKDPCGSSVTTAPGKADPEELMARCFSKRPERLASGSLQAQFVISKKVNGKEGAFLRSALLAPPRHLS